MSRGWQHTGRNSISKVKRNAERIDTHRCRDVSTSDALDRGIEVIKRLALDDLGADFTSNTKLREAAFYGHQSVQVYQSFVHP